MCLKTLKFKKNCRKKQTQSSQCKKKFKIFYIKGIKLNGSITETTQVKYLKLCATES